MGSFRIGDFRRQFEEREKRYTAAIDAEDDHGAIIRGLTYLDAELRRLIRYRVPHPAAIRLDDTNGRQLVSLSLAFGLIDPELGGALKSFVDLRNGFAHALERELTTGDVKKLLNSLRGTARDTYLLERHRYDTIGKKLRGIIHALRSAVQEAEMFEIGRQQHEELDVVVLQSRISELEAELHGGWTEP